MVILKRKVHKKGFTLIELIVSMAIFVIMTSLLVSKYGNFNQNVLLTNLAYDVAVTLRTAQTYGLSVKTSTDGSSFNYGYGVHLETEDISTGEIESDKIIFFVDSEINNKYDIGEELNTYFIKRGAFVSSLCASEDDLCAGSDFGEELDIIFKRPDPSARICLDGDASPTDNTCPRKYAVITITGSDTSTRQIVVRENGQISVKE